MVQQFLPDYTGSDRSDLYQWSFYWFVAISSDSIRRKRRRKKSRINDSCRLPELKAQTIIFNWKRPLLSGRWIVSIHLIVTVNHWDPCRRIFHDENLKRVIDVGRRQTSTDGSIIDIQESGVPVENSINKREISWKTVYLGSPGSWQTMDVKISSTSQTRISCIFDALSEQKRRKLWNDP